MFRNCLENMLNHGHELYWLRGLIDWEMFEREFGKLYPEEGRPGIPIRLMVGLTYPSHVLGTSDEEDVVEKDALLEKTLKDNPVKQYKVE